MVDLSLLLFICLIFPLGMTIFVLKDKSRILMIFLACGLFMCLFAGALDGLILQRSNLGAYYMTVRITPIVEEVLKAIPVLYYAFLFKPSRQHLLECSLCCGIGFAILENAYIFALNADSISLSIAIARGIGAGMMHGVCTMAVGFGISFVHQKRKLFVTGTFSLLTLAMVYHSLYNILVQSDYMLWGMLLPIITFTIMMYSLFNSKRR